MRKVKMIIKKEEGKERKEVLFEVLEVLEVKKGELPHEREAKVKVAIDGEEKILDIFYDVEDTGLNRPKKVDIEGWGLWGFFKVESPITEPKEIEKKIEMIVINE
jgi:hypothetical protein